MKRIMPVLKGALVAVASLVLLATQGGVHAQTNNGGGNGFVVSPVRSELTIDPGKSETVTLTVENVTGAATTAKPIVNDFEPSQSENGQPKIILDETKSASGNSFKSLVGTLPSVQLAPGEKKTLPVKIVVPGNANAGGYYGAIRFISDNGNDTDKNLSLSASVGTIFLVRVPGNLTEALQLVEFTAAKNGSTGRLFINSGNMTIVTRLKNTGNIHVKPFGKIQIADNSGKVVEEYEFNNTEPRANILPNSTRKFEDQLKNKKWIGKYTITANLGYGTGGSLITAKNSFWIIPMWVIIAGGVLLVALLVGGFLLYRKLSTGNKHKVSKTRR
jgi:hypothetical protein